MLSTRQLRYFVEIVECGSFTAAAQRLFVAQSALSRQVKALEEQLQATLFERTARQPKLTPAGEAFYPRALRVLTDMNEAAGLAQQVANGQKGVLRLSHSSTVPLTGLLLQALSNYLHGNDGISVEIAQLSSELQLKALADNQLDIGLLRLPVLRQREGVRVVALRNERLLLAVPPGHRLASATQPVELGSLREEPFISIPHPERGGLSYLAAELCMAEGFFPKAARVLSRKTTQLQLIQAGFGIALLPESMRAIAPADVRFLELRGEQFHSSTALACRQQDAPLVTRLVDHLLASAQG